MRPLWQSFNATVTTTSTKAFNDSVSKWLNQSCSLVALRPGKLILFHLLETLLISPLIETTDTKFDSGQELKLNSEIKMNTLLSSL